MWEQNTSNRLQEGLIKIANRKQYNLMWQGVIFPLVHYQMSHESIAIKGKKIYFVLSVWRRQKGHVLYLKGNKITMKSKGFIKLL